MQVTSDQMRGMLTFFDRNWLETRREVEVRRDCRRSIGTAVHARTGPRRGADSAATACLIRAMCAGVVPQHPPTNPTPTAT